MKTYTCITRVSSQARAEIMRIIDTHEKYRNSYFWGPDAHASGRRNNERLFAESNPDVEFLTKSGTVRVFLTLDESCNNVYYRSDFSLDGKKKSVRIVKNLLKY